MATFAHCCDMMKELLEENKVAIGYSKKFRSYYIDLKTSKNACQDIYYCPWCGNKLPKDLIDEYEKEVSKILGIDIEEVNLLEITDNPAVSSEFKSDEWWKKRGL